MKLRLLIYLEVWDPEHFPRLEAAVAAVEEKAGSALLALP
jgi:hypothetical protein